MMPPNLFAQITTESSREFIEELVCGSEFRLERIVSTGQTTPAGEWYDQDTEEWVAMLSGGAWLRFEDDPVEVELVPGDWLHIPAHRRHRVEWTAPDQQTVWLALHYQPGPVSAPAQET